MILGLEFMYNLDALDFPNFEKSYDILLDKRESIYTYDNLRLNKMKKEQNKLNKYKKEEY